MFELSQSRIHLQFHITGNCNLRCKHCYRTEGDTQPLTTDDVKRVIDQFIDLRAVYNQQHNIKKRGHINLTGGEPFYRDDITEIINYIYEHKNKLTYGILTNGSFIDDDTIKLLKTTEASFVQLSIDGNRETHDELRARGDYDRVFKVAKRLVDSGIKTHISFTANKKNFTQLPIVAKACRKYGINQLWSDRLVPIGKGQAITDLTITDRDMCDYINALKKAKGNRLTRLLYPETEVKTERALQFLGTDNAQYVCNAGKALIVVDEFGRVMPCRRLPIYCGDIFQSTLTDIYYNNRTFIDLRTPHIPEECLHCVYSTSCNGGARCQSYAEYGTYHKADPACPYKK